MEYEIVEKIKDLSFATDYLVIFQNKLFRMRKLKDIKYLDLKSLSKYETELKRYYYMGMLYPEIINLRPKEPELFFDYHYERNFNSENTLNEKTYIKIISYFLFLMDKLVHNINYIPKIIDFEDIKTDTKNNVYMIAPIFVNYNSSLSFNQKSIDENDLIISINNLFNLLLEKYNKVSKRINDFLTYTLNSEITCVSEFYDMFSNHFGNIINIHVKEPQFIGRKNERVQIINDISNNGKFHVFLLKGQQRIGKTNFIKIIQKELNTSKNKKTFFIRNLEDIINVLNDDYLNKVKFNSKNNLKLQILDMFYYLNDNSEYNYIFIIDDFHDVKSDFYDFFNMCENLDFTKSFIFILSTHELDLKINLKKDNYSEIFLSPFDFNECKEMIKSMLSSEFINENEEFVKILYESSKGLPGNIEEITNSLVKQNILYYTEKGWNAKKENLNFFEFDDYLDEKIKEIDLSLKDKIQYLALLGNSFTPTEVSKLQELLKTKIDMNEILNTSVIKKEDYYYRFFNLNYWKKFHDISPMSFKEKYHSKLSELTYSFEKKIWHLLQINYKKRITYAYTCRIKKAFLEWKNVNYIVESFKEMEKLGLFNYTALVYYVYYLIISDNTEEAKKYLNKLKEKKWTEYYYLIILSEVNSKDTLNIVNRRLKEKNTDFQELYLKHIKLLIISKESSPDQAKIDQLFNEIYNLYYLNKKSTQFIGIYLRTLDAYSLYIRPYDHKKCVNILENGLMVAKKNQLQRYILNLSLILAQENADNSNLYEMYVDDAIRISESSNDLSKLTNIYSRKAYQHLYKANIDEFFFNIQESIKFAKITKNKIFETQAIAIKCFYYIYNEDFENFNNEMMKLLKFNVNSSEQIQRRVKYFYLYLMAIFSIMKNAPENALKYKNEIKEFSTTLNHVEFMIDIFLSNNIDDIKQSFDDLFKGNINLEETVLILNEKFAEYDELSELFESRALELIEKAKENGLRLSYTMVYEGLAKFYLSKNNISKAFKYFRLSCFYYRAFNMQTKEIKLSNYFNKNEKVKRIFKFQDKMIKNENTSRFYADLLNISNKIISLDDTQEILDNILNFFKKKFPVSDIYLKIDSDMFEVQSVNNFEMVIPSDEVFSTDPLEIYYVSNYKDFSIRYYLNNRNLITSFDLFVEIFDSIVIIDNFLSGSLNRIIHQQNSIHDYLTGSFSRRYLYLRLEEEFEKSKREDKDLCLILLDLDDFKIINDTYGHKKGDEVLKFLVQLAKKSLRNFDILGRYGGEEFIILLPDTSEKEGVKIAERLKDNLSKESKDFFGFSVTASFGLTSLKQKKDVLSYETLIENADKATYKAKESGKNQVQIN